jgi:hypothetical protein
MNSENTNNQLNENNTYEDLMSKIINMGFSLIFTGTAILMER